MEKMSQPVILKSNRYGINLVLDDKTPFSELLTAIVDKFQETEKFFKDADMAISFDGRALTPEEEYTIVDTITKNTSVHILCILDNDKSKEQMMKNEIEEYLDRQSENTGQFFRGTLRSGQVMESASSLVIIGDVNPGARVIASGNIVVLGDLKGYAFAGANGDEHSFVAALNMDPMQIRIGSAIGRCADKSVKSFKPLRKREKVQATEPQVARVINGNISIEPITKGLLNNI
ncbi:MAG: septum site-determining protein MinC [Lachnospiraceae bacterium]